jgi:hypothetical protein
VSSASLLVALGTERGRKRIPGTKSRDKTLPQPGLWQKKRPRIFQGLLCIAGAGFEPATFGL